MRDDDNTLQANLIAGNVGRGLRVSTGGGNGPVVVLGNRIGTDTTGEAPLGNSGHGVESGSGIAALVFGGTGAGDGNQIAHNGGKGVVLDEFVAGNPLRGNSIHDNGDLAIDLGDDGPTANDPADVDVGPNQLQNFPLPTDADVVAGSTLVSSSSTARRAPPSTSTSTPTPPARRRHAVKPRPTSAAARSPPTPMARSILRSRCRPPLPSASA